MDPRPSSRARRVFARFGRSTAGALRSGEEPVARFNSSAYVALGVTVLAVVGVVIGWLQLRHDTTASTVDDVSLVASVDESYPFPQFVLDASVDLTDLPQPLELYCQPEHVRWLQDHGTRVAPITIELTNTGSGGEYVRVSDLRFQRDENAPDAKPSFVFDCRSAGLAEGLSATLALGETPADDTLTALREAQTVPVAFNLAAGESGYVQLGFGPTAQSVAGDVVFEVAAGQEVSDRPVVREGTEKSFVVPGLGTREELVVAPSTYRRVYHCSIEHGQTNWNCTPTEIQDAVAQLATDADFTAPERAVETYAAPEIEAIVEEYACQDASRLGGEVRDFVNLYAGENLMDETNLEGDEVGPTEYSLLKSSIPAVVEACGAEYATETARAMADTTGMTADAGSALIALADAGDGSR
ncbi:hypothetical protein ACIGB8_02840 [Promicromonospora sukumoe]|uniref:hypothetical protein n=1 Tax=Promicromonospora sukumoe TaxID=88382 RepID=UPI0037CA14D8